MKKSDAFPSSFLKATDATTGDLTLTIDSVVGEDLGGERKAVIRFRDSEKRLVLNKTNWGLIEEMYGEETDGWTGKKITLKKVKVDFKGDRVDSLRVVVNQNGGGNGGQKTEDEAYVFTKPEQVLAWVMKALRPGVPVDPAELMKVEDAAAAIGFAASLFDEVEKFQNTDDLTTKLGLIKDAMKAAIQARAAAGDVPF